jgi:serine hydrolase
LPKSGHHVSSAIECAIAILRQSGYAGPMRTADLDIILVAGQPISADHWIARWERNLKTARLLAPPSTAVDLEAWRQSLVAAAASAGRPCLVVGHGPGATVAAVAAGALADIPIAGAIMVAPHDLASVAADGNGSPPSVTLPSGDLGFPAMVICARNNPHLPFARARALAEDWEAEFVDAGEAGPIDDSSGQGPWPEGLMRLGRFLKRV